MVTRRTRACKVSVRHICWIPFLQFPVFHRVARHVVQIAGAVTIETTPPDIDAVILSDDRGALQEIVGREGFTLDEVIGHGENGVTWRARNETADHQVVIKFACSAARCKGGTILGNRHDAVLMREYRLSRLAEFRAPGVAVAALATSWQDCPFLVFPSVSGRPVDEVKRKFLRANAATGQAILATVLDAVTKFLNPSNGGEILSHQDLTGANMLYEKSNGVLRIIDFSQTINANCIYTEHARIEDILEDRCRGSMGFEALFKDMFKELVHLAFQTDLFVAGQQRRTLHGQESCWRKIRNMNYEDMEDEDETERYATNSLGPACSKVLSTFSLHILRWVDTVRHEVYTKLMIPPFVVEAGSIEALKMPPSFAELAEQQRILWRHANEEDSQSDRATVAARSPKKENTDFPTHQARQLRDKRTPRVPLQLRAVHQEQLLGTSHSKASQASQVMSETDAKIEDAAIVSLSTPEL